MSLSGSPTAITIDLAVEDKVTLSPSQTCDCTESDTRSDENHFAILPVAFDSCLVQANSTHARQDVQKGETQGEGG